MADINVLLPNTLNDVVTVDDVTQINATNKQSIELGTAKVANETLLTNATEITINEAMANKNNSMYIVANVTTAGNLTIKAGDAYPNRCLGDYTVSLPVGYNVIQLEDISRFETREDKIEATATFKGDIFVIGKRVGVDTVANQNSRDALAGRTLHYNPNYTG